MSRNDHRASKTPRGFSASVGHALSGLGRGLLAERNARIELAIAAVVVVLAAWLGIGRHEWAILAVCIGVVLAAEALNTAFELLADALHPDEHPLVGRAKDAAAAGVLLCALASVVVGALILGPPLWRWLVG